MKKKVTPEEWEEMCKPIFAKYQSFEKTMLEFLDLSATVELIENKNEDKSSRLE